MANVLAVDPGKITGYCHIDGDARTEDEVHFSRFLDIASHLIESRGVEAVACERFIISAQTGKFSQATWSLEQIGALRFLCAQNKIQFVLQNASDAKKFATDKRLNEIGWKRPSGAGHARDAQRHLLLYLANNRLIDPSIFITEDRY